jgi:hypothetical protein
MSDSPESCTFLCKPGRVVLWNSDAYWIEEGRWGCGVEGEGGGDGRRFTFVIATKVKSCVVYTWQCSYLIAIVFDMGA